MLKKQDFEVADTLRMVPSNVLRGENSRVFMVDKRQPNRSVFSIGDTRHNVSYKGIPAPVATGKTVGIDMQPRRFEWA